MQCMRSTLAVEVGDMEMMTIRGLEPAVKERIRRRARQHGRSMEAEAREMLREAVARDEEPTGLAQVVREAFDGADPLDVPDFTADRSEPRVLAL